MRKKRKDLLLKEWCKKVRYEDNFKVKISFMSCPDLDNWVFECFADLIIDGEICDTEIIDFIESSEEIDNIPSSMRRKAKAFYEYFNNCYLFQDITSFDDNVIRV